MINGHRGISCNHLIESNLKLTLQQFSAVFPIFDFRKFSPPTDFKVNIDIIGQITPLYPSKVEHFCQLHVLLSSNEQFIMK